LFQISYINFVLKNLAAQIPAEDLTRWARRSLVPPHLQCLQRSPVCGLSQWAGCSWKVGHDRGLQK